MKKIAAIILAAGKGKRMKSKYINKVVVSLGDKHMILHAVDRLKGLLINPIIVVVGFAKESVMKVLDGKVIFAEQAKRLGTAHAVMCGLKKVPQDVDAVLVLNGDDSAFYTSEIIEKLIKTHQDSSAALSFLTITVDNPSGLGRVVRDNNGKIMGIVEEKDATEKQRGISEINPACYTFNISFLKKYLDKIKKSDVTGEYYLTSLIDAAIKNNEKVESVPCGKILWRGINTPEELKEAERLFLTFKN
ncbi:MAG: NTP transferase domain-containing protein [Candidatus Levybacteria bacterium]|nr:NTP transferase domain-containing protein [Candidatus Levybacteria bacterium]